MDIEAVLVVAVCFAIYKAREAVKIIYPCAVAQCGANDAATIFKCAVASADDDGIRAGTS